MTPCDKLSYVKFCHVSDRLLLALLAELFQSIGEHNTVFSSLRVNF